MFVSKFKREKIQRSILELGLATINIHLIQYTCTSWFNCMTQLSLDPLFDFTIYVCKYVFSYECHSYELHISFSTGMKGVHLLP
jgi:hypothetical protein